MTTSRYPKKRRTLSRDALMNSVDSSTMETGEAIRGIEARLRSGKFRFKSLPLA